MLAHDAIKYPFTFSGNILISSVATEMTSEMNAARVETRTSRPAETPRLVGPFQTGKATAVRP